MYKVLIVDDENLVRVAFRTIVDYEKHDFTVCGTAADGIEALKVCEIEHPDLIITDIKMPHMDGLTMIEKLKEQNFDGQIILVSNYDDFDLVRKGLVMGVMDYVLKLNVGEDQIAGLLDKVHMKLDETAKYRKSREQTKEALERLRQQEQVSVWKKLLLSTQLVPRDIPQDLIRDGPMNLFVVKIVQYGSTITIGSQTDVNLVEYAVMNIGNEILTKTNCIGGLGGGDFFFACPANVLPSPEFAAQTLSSMLNKYLNLTDVVYYAVNLDSCHVLYEAIKGYSTLEDRIYYCEASHAEHLIPSIKPGTWEINLTDFAEQLNEYLRKGNRKEIHNLVQQQNRYCLEHQVSKKEVIVKWTAILMQVREQVEGTVSGDHLGDAEETLMQAGTHTELQGHLIKLFDRILDSMQPVQPGLPGEQEVSKVLNYIHSHINERIQLIQLAQLVNFNETYLCTIFRAHTGTSIINYINQTKIEHAAVELRSTKHQIKEIASDLGFSDQFYFNKMFRKYYGISPSQYRRKNEYPTKIQ